MHTNRIELEYFAYKSGALQVLYTISHPIVANYICIMRYDTSQPSSQSLYVYTAWLASSMYSFTQTKIKYSLMHIG